LTKPEPELTEAERVQVKATAKRLLAHVTEKLVLDWRKRQHTRAAVQVAAGEVLDADLPEVYGPELFDDKVRRVYEHIYASYFDNGTSVYEGAVEEAPPALVPASPVAAETTQLTESLVARVKDDPALFAELMEELFGTRDTWFRPTEALLADDETKSVEYKQTARWNINEQKKDKTMEQVIVKTVAGFLNGRGGTLLIGVTNDRQPVGLDDDYALVQPSNADGYVNWLDTMLENALGHAGAHRLDIRIDVINGRDVCRLDVPASSRPIWAKSKQGDVLYERRNNSSRAIPESEVRAFLRERFGPSFDLAAEER
jgi:type I restriction enzyme R subunit